MSDTVARWHAYVEGRDPAALDALLADEVVFRSPAVHTPLKAPARPGPEVSSSCEITSGSIAMGSDCMPA